MIDLYRRPVTVDRPDGKVVVCKTRDGGWYFAEKKPAWMKVIQEISTTRGELALGVILQGGKALVGTVGDRGQFVGFSTREPVLV